MKFKEIPSLQDLGFPVACIDIAVSPNGKKLMAIGIYKPTIKLFDLKAGIMKFERHLVSDPLKIFFLEDDGEKFAILRNDKTIEFHIKGGLHEKVRATNQPQDIVLNKGNAELYIGGNYGEINRFNLEQGRFMKSVPCQGATRLAFSDVHGILGAVSKNTLSFIDTKSRSEIFSKVYDDEITTISQDTTGLKYVIGTESGKLLEYDFRSPLALRTVELDNFPIKTCYSGKNIVAGTSKQIYFLDEKAQAIDHNSFINPGFIINTFCVEGGVVFIGGESLSIKTFINEDVGKVPDWIFDTRS